MLGDKEIHKIQNKGPRYMAWLGPKSTTKVKEQRPSHNTYANLQINYK